MMMPLRGALSPLGSGLGAAELAYLLYDAFTTDRAAGAVNGTSAEPIGGTRTVVDTESKLSITNSQLSFATGGVGYGNPGLVYSGISRVAGKVLSLTANHTTFGNEFPLAFSRAANANFGSYANVAHAFYTGASSYSAVSNTKSYPSIGGALSTSTNYQYSIVLRSTGAYFYIKGGTYTNWTLVWITDLDSTATLYPALTTSATAQYTADNIRIPETLWLPTPLLSDGFGTAGTSDGLGHAEGVAGGLGAGGSGVTWTSRVGTVGVSGGKAIATALSGDRAIATVPAGAADVLHTAAMTRGTTGVGLVLRYVDVDNYVYAVRVASNIQVIKRVAGSETTLINTAATEVNGAELREICYGTKFRTYYNNVLIGAEQTIADAALQTPQAQGLIFFDTDSTVDNLCIFARGTGNEFSALDAY